MVRSITVDHLPAVAPGASLPEPMRMAVEVAGAVPASVIPLEVAATLSTDGELTFALSKTHAIRFGDGSQAADKFLAVSTMLSGAVDMTNYCVLDVRTPSSPKVVRPPYCP